MVYKYLKLIILIIQGTILKKELMIYDYSKGIHGLTVLRINYSNYTKEPYSKRNSWFKKYNNILSKL